MMEAGCCMICGEASTRSEDDEDPTIWWTYCPDCDCWTEHPVPAKVEP